MDNVKKSLISLHIAVFLLGITALFSKLIPMSATDIVFVRSVVAGLVLFVMLKLAKKAVGLRTVKDYWMALIIGLLLSAHWVTYFAAMQYSTVAIGMIALFTFPMITVFLEPFFEPIKLVWQDIVSAIVVLVGIVLIVPEVSLENDVTLGIVLGVISAFFYAMRNLVHRKHFSHYSGPHAMLIQICVVILSLLAFISEDVVTTDSNTWLLIFILGTLCTAAPHALIASSLQHLRAKTFSLIACIQPFYGVIFAMLVLSEHPNWQTFVGGILVISAAIYETVNTHKLHQQSKQENT